MTTPQTEMTHASAKGFNTRANSEVLSFWLRRRLKRLRRPKRRYPKSLR